MIENTAAAILATVRANNNDALAQGIIFQTADQKDHNRAIEKINERFGGDATKIKDLVRGRFIVTSAEQVVAVKEALQTNENVAAIKDRFKFPITSSGHRSISSEVKLDNGHIGEIQVVHSDMLLVDKILHTKMEETQKIKRRAIEEGKPINRNKPLRKEVSKINDDMREISSAAAHDAKLNELVDPSVKNKFTYAGEIKNGSALAAIADKHNLQSTPKPSTNALISTEENVATEQVTTVNSFTVAVLAATKENNQPAEKVTPKKAAPTPETPHPFEH